ncbi:lysophospholipid acyltransferase family protein [Limibacillus halophilus]|uniref:1-acyl-sn-glycerol-3-phosphate acyltransferase n=1 Tax=Limibacillus halophilus TaxID=1579333 RepID=A0A839SWL2_9PROT|nr:lysophospholipid acyltransferase family protein [Limibacillus halophilus]MBB3066080.1 1-acyl-sn-glycerol-3-phosphate acyltransferase [Limibacillus halophilus]
MRYLGSIAFNILFIVWTLLIFIIGLPVLLLPTRYVFAWGCLWAWVTLQLLRFIGGVDSRFIGMEKLPEGPFILASKHQSTWDSLVLPRLAPNSAYVLKRELTEIPLFGAYVKRAGMIPVDREAGAPAIRSMLQQAKAAVAQGKIIGIYPQGTRTAPGTKLPYHPGVAALYTHLKLPVVPVALNSGLFWARRAWFLRPGTITLEVLDVIEPGLDRKTFLLELERRIEEASDRLARESEQ